MECLAVDWSGALTGAGTRIWIARASHGQLTALDAPGSRDAVCDTLLARLRDPTPCVAGLDFAFGMPAWFCTTRGWHDINDVWHAARDDGERWLQECRAPFWGRPGTRRTHDASLGLRETERAWPRGHQPKSVFQIGGAGSVGTGSIRGMPMLLALREAGWAVWPFDAASTHTLVEIYPRLFTGPVVKSSAAARSEYLAAASFTTPIAFRAAMTRSDDAFDAAVSAIAMSAAASESPMLRETDSVARIEGRIWVPASAQ